MRVLDKNFTYLYDIRTFDKLQIVKRAYGTSTLQMQIKADSAAAHYIRKNCYLIDEFNEPFAVKAKELSEVDNTYVIYAYSFHFLLSQRKIRPFEGNEQWTKSGSADQVIKDLVADATSGDGRDLPFTLVAPRAVEAGEATLSEASYRLSLSDEVERICAASGTFELWYFNGTTVYFDTYKSRDLTRGQPGQCIFAKKYKNLSDYTYSEDSTGECTVAYVGGKGEDAARKIVQVPASPTETGIDRVETFIDARDLEDDQTDELTARGQSAIVGTSVRGKQRYHRKRKFGICAPHHKRLLVWKDKW